jgi:hypothetical protein
MIWLLRYLFLLGLATWLGATVFLWVVAFTMFSGLSSQEAGDVMSRIFPNYYFLGYGCGLLLVVTSVMLWRRVRPGAAIWGISGILATGLLAGCLYSGLVVQPRAHELKGMLGKPDPGGTIEVEFRRAHRLSVQLNGVVLVGNLLLLALVGSSRAWRRVE